MSSILFIFKFYVQHRSCRFILYFLLCSFEGRNVNMLKVFLRRYYLAKPYALDKVSCYLLVEYLPPQNRKPVTFYIHRCRTVRNIFCHESRETSTTFQRCKLGFITSICHIMRYRYFRHFSNYCITAFNYAMR